MATLIPSINTCKDVTPGERRFARLLEAKLEEDYLCWYNVPIGPARLHPDFIILHPQRGVLILEVKDWRDKIRDTPRYSLVEQNETSIPLNSPYFIEGEANERGQGGRWIIPLGREPFRELVPQPAMKLASCRSSATVFR